LKLQQLRQLRRLSGGATKACEEAAAKSKECSELRVKVTELENTVSEMVSDRERVAKDGAATSTVIESLNARLKERSDQMSELRNSIEHMREVADSYKAKAEQSKATLASKQAEHAEREVQHQRALAEQEASFHKLMIRRLEEQAEEHKRALGRKDDDIHAARKRAKKMEDKIEKVKEKYDQKVYEYEELLSRLEEQKFEAMRNMRDRETVEIEEEQTKVQDALKAAKERNRRKADQFASGAVNSAVSGLRSQPAGSAAAMARARGGVTPPSEELDRQRSARPAGYQVGRAIPSEAPATSGGAGYSGYVPEPPRNPNPAPSAMNGGFDMVQDDYLDMGGAAAPAGGVAGGDIYDF
jgi:chromosome segregation ATPase